MSLLLLGTGPNGGDCLIGTLCNLYLTNLENKTLESKLFSLRL